MRFKHAEALARRLELRMTRKEVAEKSGLNIDTVWKLETERITNPAIETVNAIARGLEWLPEQLIDFSEDRRGTTPLAHPQPA